MKLILARHGNTFRPGDKVVWVGCRNDLPLVESGLQQARDLGVALQDLDVKLAAIYCGPLRRTREFACVVVEEAGFGLQPIVDPRLNELDYGDWSGLTSDEIRARFGERALADWDERAAWPTNAGWGESPQAIHTQGVAFVRDLESRYGAEDTVLVVSSNGRLRAFAALAEPGVLLSPVKMKTGHLGRLEGTAGRWLRTAWNEAPM